MNKIYSRREAIYRWLCLNVSSQKAKINWFFFFAVIVPFINYNICCISHKLNYWSFRNLLPLLLLCQYKPMTIKMKRIQMQKIKKNTQQKAIHCSECLRNIHTGRLKLPFHFVFLLALPLPNGSNLLLSSLFLSYFIGNISSYVEGSSKSLGTKITFFCV